MSLAAAADAAVVVVVKQTPSGRHCFLQSPQCATIINDGNNAARSG